MKMKAIIKEIRHTGDSLEFIADFKGGKRDGEEGKFSLSGALIYDINLTEKDLVELALKDEGLGNYKVEIKDNE